ncbi:MAG: DUF1186 domain-containing protein [Bacteroidetes bacterium]|nr:DUF1186 domain-containing protein [Bacteroidota bacterium]
MGTIQPPEFRNPLIDELYLKDMRIDPVILKEILSLPREPLIDDLQKVLQDSVDRYDFYYSKPGWDEATQCFPLHALYLLKELQSTKSLTLLLDVLHKDDRFLDYWFSDFITEGMWEIIMVLGKDNPGKLLEFMKDHSVYTYVRSEISVAKAETALHEPGRRGEVIVWYKDLLNFWLSDEAETQREETELKGLVVCNLIDIRATELIPEISRLYDEKLAWPGVAGPLEHVIKDIQKSLDVSKKRKIQTIFEKYHEIITTWASYTGELDDDDDAQDDSMPDNCLRYPSSLKPLKPTVKVGRNDPCPCGSGRKYKKCCINEK